MSCNFYNSQIICAVNNKVVCYQGFCTIAVLYRAFARQIFLMVEYRRQGLPITKFPRWQYAFVRQQFPIVQLVRQQFPVVQFTKNKFCIMQFARQKLPIIQFGKQRFDLRVRDWLSYKCYDNNFLFCNKTQEYAIVQF